MTTELAELEKVTERVLRAWRLARDQNNDLFLDAVALNLHGFYPGDSETGSDPIQVNLVYLYGV